MLGSDGISQCKANLNSGWISSSTVVKVKKRLAKLLVDEQQYSEVISLLDDVVKSGRASHIDYSNRGISHYRNSQLAAAAADFKQAYLLNAADDGYLADLVNTLIDQKDFKQALAFINSHVAAHPGAKNVLTLAATVHYESGDYIAARASIDAAIAKEGDNPNTQNLYGLILEKSGERDLALVAYGKAIELQSDNAVFLINRAQLNSELGHTTEAESDFKAALAISRDSKPLTGLATLYLDLGQTAEAKILLDESMRLEANSADTNYALGRYHVVSGDEADAIKYLDRSLALDPGYSMAKYWRAVLEYNKGRFAEALKRQTALLEVWPKNLTLRLDIGDSLMDIERYQEALVSYSLALAIDPSSRYGFEARARAHIALENYYGAISDASKAIAIDVKSTNGFYRRAYSNWQLGNNVAARADYDKAAELATDRSFILHERAEFLFFTGEVEESRKIALQQIAAGEKSFVLTRLKGRLAEYDGDYEKALLNYEAARKEDPKNLWILEDVAWAQIANAQPATALETCNSMRLALPKSPEANRCRAKALMRMSRDAEALQALEAALSIAPDFFAAALDKAYVQISMNKNEEAIATLGELVRKKYRLATSEYYRGLAFENLKEEHLALKSYESALGQADPYLAKDIAKQLNRLRAKIPLDKLPGDLLYPQKSVRR